MASASASSSHSMINRNPSPEFDPSSTAISVESPSATTFSAVHSDILRTQILTRLDGPSLAAAACAASSLHVLAANESLWRDICTATWPSLDNPLLGSLLPTFPSGHRSFYSDSFPVLHQNSRSHSGRDDHASELISAVDFYYQGKPIFSRVLTTETKSDWFLFSPFRVDLLDPKDSVPTPIRHAGENRNEDWLRHLEENVTLSWILIDPTRKRAGNVSSRSPVKVQYHWLTGDVELQFTTVMSGCNQRRGSSLEHVQCRLVVTCAGKEGKEMEVREVSLKVEDMEGRMMNGRESLVTLEGAIETGERRKWKEGEAKERYGEFLEIRREKRKRKEKRERALDMLCIVSGASIFMAFLSFVLFR